MDQNSFKVPFSKAQLSSLKFGDFPGGVSLNEKPPFKVSPSSEGKDKEQAFHRLNQQGKTSSCGVASLKSETTDFEDDFGIHSQAFSDTEEYGFCDKNRLHIWHSNRSPPSAYVNVAPSFLPPLDETEFRKQLAAARRMNEIPASTNVNGMEGITAGNSQNPGHHRHQLCNGEANCGPMKRYDSSYCSDNDEMRAVHSQCPSCSGSHHVPSASFSDIKKNAENIDKDRCGFATNEGRQHSTHCTHNHGGATDDFDCHEYFGVHRMRNAALMSNNCPIENTYPMSSHKTPTFPGRAGAHGIESQKSMDMQSYMHSNHRNDMSGCSHVDNPSHGEPDMAGHRYHREGKHKHCGIRRPAPIDACGPFCREWHGEHIFPDDDPPPSHMMGKGKYNPLYKTEMCRNWSEMGHCRYGRTCQFAHGRSELRQVPRHNQWKTKTCGAWLNGTCSYGHRCCYAHRTSGGSVDNEPHAYGMSRFAEFFEGSSLDNNE